MFSACAATIEVLQPAQASETKPGAASAADHLVTSFRILLHACAASRTALDAKFDQVVSDRSQISICWNATMQVISSCVYVSLQARHHGVIHHTWQFIGTKFALASWAADGNRSFVLHLNVGPAADALATDKRRATEGGSATCRLLTN